VKPSTPTGDSAFKGFAEAEATATVHTLITRAAKPALEELEALRVALDVRCASLVATIAETGNLDPVPVQELVERLVHAAGEEANAAAQAARALAVAEAETRLALERADAEKELELFRADAEKRLELLRADAAHQRETGRRELESLTEALNKAKTYAETVRAEADAHFAEVRAAREQAETLRADRDAHLQAASTAREHVEAMRADRDAQAETAKGARERIEALRTDRDAHVQAAKTARDETDAIRADRDAQVLAATTARQQVEAMLDERETHAEAVRAATQQVEAMRADRDAHAEAITAATQQVEAMRADRDARAETASAAGEQIEAIRADRDAQAEAARAAMEQLEATRADRDAHAETARTSGEQVETLRADRDAHVETARAAREHVEAITADRDAQVALARIAKEQIEAMRLDRDAIIAAARAEQTQLLAETHTQLEAACLESERLMAARLREIEALRTELEHARAEVLRAGSDLEHARTEVSRAGTELEHARTDVLRARAEASPVERPATQPVNVRADVEPIAPPTLVQPQPAASAAATREQLHAPSVQTQAPPVAARAVASAPIQAVDDPLPAGCRAVDEAANISQVLDGMIDGVGAVFPRAALFVVKAQAKRLQGWRSVGFTGVAAITREFEFSLATDSALTRAVNAGRMVLTGDGSRDGQAAEQPGEPWTVTFPVITGDRVVAVVHADAGGRNGEQAAAFDRDTALEISRELIRRGGLRLTALTTSVRAAFGNVMGETPAAISETPAAVVISETPATISVPAAAVVISETPAAISATPTASDAVGPTASQEDAGRYASQLVSEINRYKQPAATTQAPDQHLQERLTGEIEGSRSLDAVPAPSAASTALGMFDEAMGKMLGNDGLETKGPSEQEVVAVRPLSIVQS
jgi:hypothetical protein